MSKPSECATIFLKKFKSILVGHFLDLKQPVCYFFQNMGMKLIFPNLLKQRFIRKDNQRQLLYYVNLIRACLDFDQFDHQLVYMDPRICVVNFSYRLLLEF